MVAKRKPRREAGLASRSERQRTQRPASPQSNEALADRLLCRHSDSNLQCAKARIAEHLAGADDFQVAMATYHAARKRWPEAAMNSRRILTGRSAPELLEPIRRKFGVPERVLDVLVAEVGL